jgi:hypothetical protein
MSASQPRRRSFEILARIGYGTCGAVYVMVGVLALWAAISAGNHALGGCRSLRAA